MLVPDASLTGFEALDALRKLADDPDVGVIRLLCTA